MQWERGLKANLGNLNMWVSEAYTMLSYKFQPPSAGPKDDLSDFFVCYKDLSEYVSV